ncbi:calcium-binding protein [Falsiroseomonas sp. E2-1-a20]
MAMPTEIPRGKRPLDDVDLVRVAGGAGSKDPPAQQEPDPGQYHLDQGDAGASFTGGSGQDTIRMGQGDDSAAGGAGNDIIHGDNFLAAQAIAGDPGELLYTGHDTLDGGDGQDTIYGDSASHPGIGGNDVISGGTGDGAADRVFGGAGDDVYTWRPGDGSDRFDGGTGLDTLHLPGMPEEVLRMGLMVTGGLELRSLGQGLHGFFDAAGNPATASGQVTVKGETMSFVGLEYIRLT